MALTRMLTRLFIEEGARAALSKINAFDPESTNEAFEFEAAVRWSSFFVARHVRYTTAADCVDWLESDET